MAEIKFIDLTLINPIGELKKICWYYSRINQIDMKEIFRSQAHVHNATLEISHIVIFESMFHSYGQFVLVGNKPNSNLKVEITFLRVGQGFGIERRLRATRGRWLQNSIARRNSRW